MLLPLPLPLPWLLQARAHLPAHLPHGALQPALHLLHAGRRRGAHAKGAVAHHGRDHAAGGWGWWVGAGWHACPPTPVLCPLQPQRCVAMPETLNGGTMRTGSAVVFEQHRKEAGRRGVSCHHPYVARGNRPLSRIHVPRTGTLQATLFVECGVTKIRLTGGEPTLRPDIGQLAGRLGALRGRGLRSLGLTSNGIVLGRQLPALKEAGGSRVQVLLVQRLRRASSAQTGCCQVGNRGKLVVEPWCAPCSSTGLIVRVDGMGLLGRGGDGSVLHGAGGQRHGGGGGAGRAGDQGIWGMW